MRNQLVLSPTGISAMNEKCTERREGECSFSVALSPNRGEFLIITG